MNTIEQVKQGLAMGQQVFRASVVAKLVYEYEHQGMEKAVADVQRELMIVQKRLQDSERLRRQAEVLLRKEV